MQAPEHSTHDGPVEQVRLVPKQDHDLALSLLLTGKRRVDSVVLERFRWFARYQGLATDALWAVYDEQGPAASAMLVPSPGRAAMLFLSPLNPRNPRSPRNEADGPTTATAIARVKNLAQAVFATLTPDRVRLVQALLEPEQQLEEQALAQAGFFRLAALSYLRADIEPGGVTGSTSDPVAVLPPGYTVQPWSELLRSAFVAAIEGSYQGTLDCPGLVGLRTMDDVVAGHMAAAGPDRFDPSLWHVVFDGTGAPAGVLLLAEIPLSKSMELVYLGLLPAARGQKLGQALVRFALRQAHQRKVEALTLAVDDDNVPALKLYQAAGFSVTAHKLAMTWSLNETH